MAKISIISDLHIGFKRGTEREKDAFEAAKRVFKKARELDSDLVILPGDIFDSRFPRPENWSGLMGLLSTLKDGDSVKVLEVRNREDVNPEALKGVPVIAIHGTHERRGSGMTNPIEGLEEGGFLIHLHCSSVLLEVGGEKIGIHGMSGVPEKYSKEVLKKWGPKPFDGAYNIFMLHQDLDPYIYNPARPPKLGLENLPEGFDLYVSGHIHWREETEVMGKPFIIPGSLVPTQLKKKEAEIDKGFYFLDTEKEEVDFVAVEPPRKFFYREVEADDSLRDVEKKVEKELEEIFSGEFDKRSIIRIKLKGKLPEGVDSSDLNLARVRKKYDYLGLISISESFKEKGVENKIEMLRDARSDELSVDEMGMEILRKQLEELGSKIDPDSVFEGLVEGEVEDVMQRLLNKKEDVSEEESGDEEVGDGKEDREREGDIEEVKGGENESDTDEWWRKSG